MLIMMPIDAMPRRFICNVVEAISFQAKKSHRNPTALARGLALGGERKRDMRAWRQFFESLFNERRIPPNFYDVTGSDLDAHAATHAAVVVLIVVFALSR
jgi:hypothetical protein